ncbi:Lovastatin diketide synthase LovF, partial [Madurella mycetomatis]
IVLRTGCSASLYGLHLACQSLQSGDISSALVGGCNLIMNPAKVETMYNVGVLSKSASSKSFDAAADGYARGEAINMIYVKRLDDALRDGNPIRAVIRATASNCDGKTQGLTKPSSEAHEALIRATYAAAGLENEMGRTGFFECHATGTSSGDPEEGMAVANVFGDKGGLYIGSVKPNMGHSEGASGLTSLLKCVLALENRVIPPNIKFRTPNPKSTHARGMLLRGPLFTANMSAVPFEQGGLRVPTEPVPWPVDRHERTSINSFGVGGANAHVILDSAAAFGIRPGLPATSPTGSRLLVFTANDAESARRGALECSRHVVEKPETLTDAAFTLGLRREHFPYRTFAIGDMKDASPVEFSVPAKAPAAPPSVAFVFTGQGAQWPTMGAKLLSEHPSALQQLQLMEMSLSSLGPDLAPNWTLSGKQTPGNQQDDEELMRPKESSKVYRAEFSQPLCTAVQILVVNLLRDWGIVPAAVIGHSSGEIAAAYACGALTMGEAIVCAYLRGRVTTAKPTTRTGAMAAVGLGATDIQPYLVDGVVIACENSPSSTTLSGDEDKIVHVLKTLEQDHPGVFTRRLQVDMAYHSHHMKELGDEYERLLAPHLSGKAPSVPFFSTVTNNVIQTNGELGASYWRSNLESPVLFRTGVEKLLQSQGVHSVLVEVGPHSALAGPLRQILKHLRADQTSYVATLVRNGDDRRALLATAGHLFCKGLATIQFGAVNPAGRVLTSLPCYPWNHGTKYWYESRVSQEYRGRRFAHHQTLGSRVVEVSQTEPSWRNVLRLDNAPWCRDHKVAGDVVFPGTGYLSMAGEAMRQLSGASHVTLRQVTIASALILSSAATEVVLSMRPYKLTNTLDSPWHEFTISSYNETSNSWTKHCFGQIRAASDQHPLVQGRDITHLPRDVDPDYWYKAMRAIGLSYGPAFQGLSRISADPLHNIAVADLRLDAVPESEDQDHSATYYIHPATSDACMQLFSAAAARGQARSIHGKAVPTYIGEAYFSSPSSSTVTVEATADVQPGGAILGNCVGVDPSTKAVVLTLRDVKLAPLDDGEMADKDPHAGGRLHWKPDVDFQDAGRLIHSRKKVREAYYRLQKLVLLCCIVAREQCGGIEAQAEHLAKFQSWIGGQVEQAKREGYPLLSQAEVQELLQLSPADRTSRILQYLDGVLETEYATIGKVVCRVFNALGGILRGEVDGLEILRQDDALAEIYSLGNQWDYGPFLGLLNHRTPHLRVLEIGAGTGATTDLVLQGLQGNFYSYTFTDVSAGFFPAARERFRRVGPRMRFQKLDITRDPTEQGFAPGSFDLIVAANVLHVTPRLATALANVRRLLRPDGRLLMQEMHMTVKWLNFAMGPLPGWWLGEQDGRGEEPYVSPQRWAGELVAAGFSPPQASVYDDEAPYQANVTIIAAPHISWAPEPAVSLLSELPEGSVARSISASLQRFGLEVATVSLAEKPKGAVISILDLEGGDPYLSGIAADEFARFQTFLSGLDPAGPGMLWLTRPSQMRCPDPRYAGILGLLRTARNELGTPLSTLELDLDSLSSPPEATWRVVFDVYQKMRRMRAVEQDALADPDYEYAFSGGKVYLPRFHWISVAGELAEPAGECQTYKRLEIGKRGSLQTMKWVERPVVDNLKGDEIYVDVRAVGMNFK